MRLLLLQVPRLLRELLEEAIQTAGECELVNDASVHTPVDAAAPDAVILGLTAREDTALLPALFARWPRAQVMTVTATGEAAMIYELSLRTQALGELSPAEVIETLRNTVRPPGGHPLSHAHARTI